MCVISHFLTVLQDRYYYPHERPPNLQRGRRAELRVSQVSPNPQPTLCLIHHCWEALVAGIPGFCNYLSNDEQMSECRSAFQSINLSVLRESEDFTLRVCSQEAAVGPVGSKAKTCFKAMI